MIPSPTNFPPEDIPAIRGALLRYRVMAWIVGVMLIVLTLVAMPLKYIGHDDRWVTWTGVPHGWLYPILIILAYDLGRRVKWGWGRMLGIMLAGTVPFATFVAEHLATQDVKRRIALVEAAGSDEAAEEPGFTADGERPSDLR